MQHKSLLEEIISFAPKQDDKYADIEAKASNIITSAINLLGEIDNKFDEHEAAELTRRFYVAIKTSDYSKFESKIRTLLSKSGSGDGKERFDKKP